MKNNNIDFRAINSVKSKENGETTLYVGIKDPSLLKTYEEKTKNLFKNYQSRRSPTSNNHHHINRENINRRDHRRNHCEEEINRRNNRRNYREDENNRNNRRNYREDEINRRNRRELNREDENDRRE